MREKAAFRATFLTPRRRPGAPQLLTKLAELIQCVSYRRQFYVTDNDIE